MISTIALCLYCAGSPQWVAPVPYATTEDYGAPMYGPGRPRHTKAPELAADSTGAALTLLAGMLAVVRGRKLCDWQYNMAHYYEYSACENCGLPVKDHAKLPDGHTYARSTSSDRKV
jgi:hypothetical protein